MLAVELRAKHTRLMRLVEPPDVTEAGGAYFNAKLHFQNSRWPSEQALPASFTVWSGEFLDLFLQVLYCSICQGDVAKADSFPGC